VSDHLGQGIMQALQCGLHGGAGLKSVRCTRLHLMRKWGATPRVAVVYEHGTQIGAWNTYERPGHGIHYSWVHVLPKSWHPAIVDSGSTFVET
jgi:hypothetical protein